MMLNFISRIYQKSKIKSSTFKGTPCDDTEYRNSNGSPNWKNYGRFLSECDSLSTTYFDAEFAEMDKVKRIEQAIKELEKTIYRPKMMILSGRDKSCTNPELNSLILSKFGSTINFPSLSITPHLPSLTTAATPSEKSCASMNVGSTNQVPSFFSFVPEIYRYQLLLLHRLHHKSFRCVQHHP